MMKMQREQETMEMPAVEERGVAVKGEMEAPDVGRTGPIGEDELRRAWDTLEKYKSSKAQLEKRVVENEQWYRLRHWQVIGKSANAGDPEPTSAWLFNSIANKHADAMDNFPEPVALPREQSDEAAAKLLTEVLPVVLEQADFEEVYSDYWWAKLKSGTAVIGVFWDPRARNGLGDIDLRPLDLLNLFWEPGVKDIQRSRNLFHVELVDEDLLKGQYPHIKEPMDAQAADITKYVYDDTVDTTGKAAVVDWYYKVNVNGKDLLHYCKFTGSNVLYASENDPAYAERGYYDHGMYPVVYDVLFPVEGSPAGFGYIDVCKSPQMYIDKLDQLILKSAAMNARQRYWVKEGSLVDEKEFTDWSKDLVHVAAGNLKDNIVPIDQSQLPAMSVNVRTLKVDELKETSGNRDFSQGSVSGGVTSGSAIAALQEAGSKLSRDMIKGSYRAFREVCTLCIELMRQFYTEDRYFRVVGDTGRATFQRFNAAMIGPQMQGMDFGMDMGMRVPVFDIDVKAQKSSPFAIASQNERAKELYGMGFFRPDLADQALAALDMMDFEGVERVRERIGQNGTMYQQMMQMQQELQKLAAIVDATQGTAISAGMEGGARQAVAQGRGGGQDQDAMSGLLSTNAQQTRERAAAAAAPR